MLTLRKSDERGHFNHGWLDTKHSFSFGSYFDMDHMGFRALRVINEDLIAPDSGFGTHPHRDMEILTYVLSGAIAHKDSMGHSEILKAGELQRMTAGTGVRHSEFNPSGTDPTHMLQIWIKPAEKGLTPSYQKIAVPQKQRESDWVLLASPNNSASALTVHQDVSVHSLVLDAEKKSSYELGRDRHLWIQITKGSFEVEGVHLQAGDGLSLSEVKNPSFKSLAPSSELVLFDLA